MDPHAHARLRARACHAEALLATGGDRTAAAVVAAVAAARDLEVVPFEPGTRFGIGTLGVYERVGRLVSVDATLPPGRRELVVAHEVAHHELHDDPVGEVVAVDAAPGAAARVVGYSHRERREVEAEAFASELLCPGDWLRGELVDRGRRPSEVARALGLPRQVVARQAIRAVCLPPPRPPTPSSAPVPRLDTSQLEAATWDRGALLVEAGPGTGKTATLVGRVAHLLATGVAPSRILVLTFGTRAADEVRARVGGVAPEAAGALWAGTFHAFGLEVCLAWHFLIGRGPRPRVLDRDGAVELLERHLGELPASLRDQAPDAVAGLAAVMRAIERCKEGMVTPEEYAAAARSRDGGDAADAAAVEVAAAYATYQRLLAEADALDLADLVALAARLLSEHDDVARHYGARFAHVLVDEVQDVDAASLGLLRSLCGPGTSLWAVGDGRQSIYRFRGAHPGVVDDFAEAFGGSTLSLRRTYRATPEVVGAFSAFSGTMPGGAGAWAPERPSGAPVRVLAASTPAGEVAALRDRVEELRAAGVGYGEQVVLARTHRSLERVGAGLERHGVPTLFVGDLFAREEVRDLLALASVDVEPGGLGLLRLATRPPYGVARADVVAAIRWASAEGATVAEALGGARSIPGLGDGAARGLALLGRHLAAAGPAATAWAAMTTWLLETHAVAPLAGQPASTRAAVHQLLRLAAEEGTDRAAFLARVRRIAALGGGRDRGVVPPEAQSGDAVRLMTVHAAKGLEFAAVHLPMASSRHLPLPRRPDERPPPPDLARLAMGPAEHDAEERSLFFVALSRARDHLTVSHARRYGPGRDARPSPYLGHLGHVVATRHDDPGLAEPTAPLLPQAARPGYPIGELDAYLRCPARYRYEVVDGLADVSPPPGRRRLGRAVAAAVRRLEADAAAGASPTYADGEAALAASWVAVGPVGDRHERLHRVVADRLVARLTEVVATEVGARHHRARWAVDVGAGVLVVAPSRVVEHPWGAVTVQVVGARRRDQPRLAGLLAALSIGARDAFPGARVAIELVDPDDGEVVEADPVDDEAVVERYRDAIADVERGAFAPRPSSSCPSCPFFLVCGA